MKVSPGPFVALAVGCVAAAATIALKAAGFDHAVLIVIFAGLIASIILTVVAASPRKR